MLTGQPYGKPADVWALGVVMYELLTLQRPFPAANIFILEKKVRACDSLTMQHASPCWLSRR